eukprot:gene8969-12098_t
MNKLSKVDDEYEAKMVAFQIDCQEGKGEPAACHHVGEFFSVVKSDFVKAASIYTLNCERGYPASCFNLGKFYLSGRGVTQSDDKAEHLFEKSCQGTHQQGCYHKALLQYMHDGVTDDDDSVVDNTTKSKLEAMKIFEKNCKDGDIESCYFAASHYISPSHKVREPLKAIDFLKFSCSANHAPSCFNLAVLYKNGDIGVPADAEQHEKFKSLTNNLIHQFGGLNSTKTN